MPEPARPLFLDTGALYARFDPGDVNHDRGQETFEKIRTSELRFRLLYTSRYVLSKLATLTQRQLSRADAVRALNAVRSSEQIRILTLTDDQFDAVCGTFEQYDDQGISFDHTSGILADRYDIDHIFAFDSDFSTLGFTRVPGDP